jgi:Winged helix-turn helix
MSMARVVIMAVVLEGRPKSAVARDYGVSRRWVQILVARYLAEGEAAFEPRSRRPHASPQRTSQEVGDANWRDRQPLVRTHSYGMQGRAARLAASVAALRAAPLESEGGQEGAARPGGAHACGSRVPSMAAWATSVRRRLVLRA